jgi:hypothetical protein
MPALRGLSSGHRQLVTRTIGGHPRLIEFLDVLLRHGTAAMFQHVTAKLHQLADRDIDLTQRRNVGTGITDAVRLSSRGIPLGVLAGNSPRRSGRLRFSPRSPWSGILASVGSNGA